MSSPGGGFVGPAELEIESIYRDFRKPLDDDPILCAAPEAVREWLGRYLWGAMIAGTAVEEVALRALMESGLRCDQIEMVRKCFRERVRPRVSDDEIQRIRKLLAARP